MSKRKVFSVTTPYDQLETIPLGFAGENLARTVEWDIGPWVETYGEGEVQLLAKRPVDKNPYPVVVTRDGNSVLWTVRKEDLWDGNEEGRAQLFYLVDGQVVARSKAFRTMTREAIEGDVQECSEPERDWVEQVLQSVAAAEESAGAAGEASKAAEESARQAVEAEERLRQTIEETAVAAAENAANAAVEKATQVAGGAADSAVESAEDAAGSAGVAREKAEEAGKSAEAAAKSAEAAGLAEEKAGTYAGQAEESVADAKEQVDAAVKSAELANQSAGRAEEAAVQAAESAEAAAGDAADAKESADDAADSALSAAESAEMAQAYSGKPPVITDDIWYVWDAETDAYLSTGKPSRGEQGLTGPQGAKGEPGAGVGSVVRTAGNGAAGTTDTYTMYNDEGEEIGNFEVYNGANGDGAGDFMANGSVAMTGVLDVGGNRISNVGIPVEKDDAIPKEFYDYWFEKIAPKMTVSGEHITIENGMAYKLMDLKLYGKSIQNGTPTPDNPIEILSVGKDGNVLITLCNSEGESQDLFFPNSIGLLGIPVESDGNYIDENGQQWVCDEVDYGKKKYIRRINLIQFTGDEKWNPNIPWDTRSPDIFHYYTIVEEKKKTSNSKENWLISNMFIGKNDNGNSITGEECIYSNYADQAIYIFLNRSRADTADLDGFRKWIAQNRPTVYYIMQDPVEIPLTDEQIQSFQELMMYDYKTVISSIGNPAPGVMIRYILNDTYVEDLVEKISQVECLGDILIGQRK